ncbi:MAG: DUF167 domain-containing protein [Smithellaceae bacterium]
MTFPIKESKHGLTFDVQVTPRAARPGIAGVQDEALKVKVSALPVEGAANTACIKLLAKELGLKKSQLEIFAGHKSRRKTILIKEIPKPELEKRISGILRELCAVSLKLPPNNLFLNL